MLRASLFRIFRSRGAIYFLSDLGQRTAVSYPQTLSTHPQVGAVVVASFGEQVTPTPGAIRCQSLAHVNLGTVASRAVADPLDGDRPPPLLVEMRLARWKAPLALCPCAHGDWRAAPCATGPMLLAGGRSTPTQGRERHTAGNDDDKRFPGVL
ncbi:hypothetical protein NDU88_004147 [Pleurodeles waltl]|uniref:Uncharacterized protein n=1 Tax=Pleurodeles waltl TaxID=8319 RepID=A0AAV7VG88_PLEWA|nr:hypothetical protein NDU88_004147 [Pleurodeles waltl]